MTKKLEVLLLGRMDYKEALDIQNKLLLLRQSGEIGDTLLILEHPPVLTLGRRGLYSNIVASNENLAEEGVSLYEVSRGGDVTYHGPGQIVGYPIIHLADDKMSVKEFVGKARAGFLLTYYKKNTRLMLILKKKKYTGVWVGDEKITAIGIEVKTLGYHAWFCFQCKYQFGTL